LQKRARELQQLLQEASNIAVSTGQAHNACVRLL
jgi:hypothetical protein